MSTLSHLPRVWLKRGPLACVLRPVSWVYAALLALRRTLYRLGIKHTERLPVPVVVVGNVVVGGAGKTPTVIQLVEHLRQQGWTPGVISRGHGRQGNVCIEVNSASLPADVGDEPLLIAQRTGVPLVVGRQRVCAGKQLLQQHPEVDILVSDDGMQHWNLARDLTVVVFDDRGTGNGWLLPAGLLREQWPARPWGSSQMLVLRNSSVGESTTRHAVPKLQSPFPLFSARRQLSRVAVASDGVRCTLDDLAKRHAHQPLGAVAGIAQPEAFFAMLRNVGVPLTQTLALPDHADPTTLANAIENAKPAVWLCTEKDAVKLFALPPEQRPRQPIWAVPLEQIPDPALFQAVDVALEGLSSKDGRQTP